jgi:hypothetical protein
MKDSDIDFSDIPELGPDSFKNAVLWRPRAERNKREADAHVPLPLQELIADVLKVKPPEKSKAKPNEEKQWALAMTAFTLQAAS